MIRYLAVVLVFIHAGFALPHMAPSEPCMPQESSGNSNEPEGLLQDIQKIRTEPFVYSRYNYNVTAGVRLLIFRHSMDNVVSNPLKKVLCRPLSRYNYLILN